MLMTWQPKIISEQEVLGIVFIGVVTRSLLQFCKLLQSIIFWSTLQLETKALVITYNFQFQLFSYCSLPLENKLNGFNTI